MPNRSNCATLRMGPIAMMTAALALAGCATGAMAPDEPRVSGILAAPDGTPIGSTSLTANGAMLRGEVSVRGLAAGRYGMHLHAVGQCAGPAFASAGAHWNPTMAQHGRLNPAGRHSGDLPNLVVGADGSGRIAFDVPGPISGAGGLLDADGAAIIIHAAPDDERTDPSGNSGDRKYCAVLRLAE